MSALTLAAACTTLATPTPTRSPTPSSSPTATVAPTLSIPATLTPRPTQAPTPTATPIAPTADGVVEVPILYMHRVVEPDEIASWTAEQRRAFLPYLITPCELEAKLDYLVAQGYTTILPGDLVEYWDAERSLPGRPVMLTFDDGSPDWAATILPMLRARGQKAEFYVTVHRIGEYLAWTDLEALVDAGMGIGAHDMDHFQLAGGGVTTASLDTMRYQVGRAREVLSSRLGVDVDSMAYVGGGFDETLLRVVREAGYTTARAIIRGTTQSPGARYRLRVSRIGQYDDVVGKTYANLLACELDPSLPDFQDRLDGTDPG